MPFTIQNWKLALLALVFIILFTSLGFWQLSRAEEKKILLKSFAERTESSILKADKINQSGDWRFYRVELQGTFDNSHIILLDNKIYEGKVGYEVYTPFKAKSLNNWILVDRGFIPIGVGRKQLPIINPIIGEITITGILNMPPTYFTLGKNADSKITTWPLRAEYINLNELSTLLTHTLYPYVINISPKDPAAYAVTWQVVTMSPEKHTGYAVQWFAFAITLLILFVALNRKKREMN